MSTSPVLHLYLPAVIVAASLVFKASSYAKPLGWLAQSPREIPIIASADVVIVGGTVAAIAAAEAAASDGAEVFLLAPRPYLGEDLCATLRLTLGEDQSLTTPLAKKLFPTGRRTKPAHVKATLAKVLLDAKVDFLFSSYATDVLRDVNDKPSGIVIANRAGRQAIIAKVIIDATPYAWVCRMAGCQVVPWPKKGGSFERTVLRPLAQEEGHDYHTYSLSLPLDAFSFAALAEAEQAARDSTYSKGVLRGAETLFCVPPNPVLCFLPGKPLRGSLCPRDEERLYVLSGCTDLPRKQVTGWLRPAAMEEFGVLVGRTAAAVAGSLPGPSGVRVPTTVHSAISAGDIREQLSGARPVSDELPVVPCGASSLPVLADVDVVVIGGGTAGAPAAIAAARQGLRTLVVEYQEGLGGVGTLGLIGKPYHGKKIGFSKEVPFPLDVEQKMEWYRRELRKAGATIWFGAMGCGAVVENDVVKGAVVCTPEGRGVILSKVVIDATGNGDVAVSAGADYMYGTVERGDIALQGTGLPERKPGAAYTNSDYLLVDESDMFDVWRALVSVQIRRRSAFDVGTLIQTRERRRVVGDFVMRYVDQIAGRTYPDSVVLSASDYDSHGYPSSPFFGLLPHDKKSRKQNHPAPGGSCYTPYRCLLPRGLDGILVIGLGISMDRDASALVRMQLDMANQGYAAGIAAAMAVQDGVPPRRVDVRALQRHLIKTGSLQESVLRHQDSFPLPADDVQKAVKAFAGSTNPKSAGKPLAIVLTHAEEARAPLLKALAESEGQRKIQIAQVLASQGNKDVVPVLIATLNEVSAWDAKIFQGNMAEYAHLPTPIDSIILALGHAGDRSATLAILRMLRLLDANTTLSHHRSVGLALENLRDPVAAGPLAELLNKPTMRGYAMTALPSGKKAEERTASLREITLARALLRCGDYQGLGRSILETYRHDLRGLFARHAEAVLEEGNATSPPTPSQ